MDSEEEMSDCVPVESVPPPLPLAATSVLLAYEKNPSLRQGFVSGNRAALQTAMSEVRSTFQPKKKEKSYQMLLHKVAGKPRKLISSM